MAKTYQEMIAEAKAVIVEIDPAELESRLGDGTAVIDVREADEFEQGAIPGARLIPRGLLESNIGMQIPDRETPIAIYCAGGARSALAAKSIADMGYSNVVSMAGGFGRWKSEGRTWSEPVTLSKEQKIRYSRHTLLPEVG